MLPTELVKKHYRFDPLCTTTCTLADTGEKVVDPEWITTREAKLKIHPYGVRSELCVPASNVFSLVMSYVFSRQGFAQLRSDLIPNNHYAPQDAIAIQLTFIGKGRHSSCWQERVYCLEQRFNTFCEGRQGQVGHYICSQIGDRREEIVVH